VTALPMKSRPGKPIPHGEGKPTTLKSSFTNFQRAKSAGFLFSSFSGVFAAPLDDKYSSGTSDTRTSSYVSDQDSQKDDSQKGEETKKVDKPDALDEYQEKEKVQREINSYILEAYKIQGNKILKDIDISLQKINLDK
jgi:hypothetical protein